LQAGRQASEQVSRQAGWLPPLGIYYFNGIRLFHKGDASF